MEQDKARGNAGETEGEREANKPVPADPAPKPPLRTVPVSKWVLDYAEKQHRKQPGYKGLL